MSLPSPRYLYHAPLSPPCLSNSRSSILCLPVFSVLCQYHNDVVNEAMHEVITKKAFSNSVGVCILCYITTTPEPCTRNNTFYGNMPSMVNSNIPYIIITIFLIWLLPYMVIRSRDYLPPDFPCKIEG